MKSNKLGNCQICKSNKAIRMLDLDCGNLDGSTLYRSVKIVACGNCGHVYNDITSQEYEGLVKYYNEEYAPVNLYSSDKKGDRPGSSNPFTLERYAQLYELIAPYIKEAARVLDVGCATGGFLDYLRSRGARNLHGIDIIEKYLEVAKNKADYVIKSGDAESIPFENSSMDLITMDQVMEHLLDPAKAFREAGRVLREGGLFCLGVPDASRYDKLYYFDFYWFLMREHIQHYDIEHLSLLAASEGFELVAHSRSETPMMSEKMVLPNLNVVFRLAGKKGKMEFKDVCFKLTEEIKRYIANDLKRLDDKRKIIQELIVSQKPVYVWGIGREFLYLYESAGLKKCNIAGLIDVNPYKQKYSSVDGKKIMDKAVLKESLPGSAVVITAIAHGDSVKTDLKMIGYKGMVIEI